MGGHLAAVENVAVNADIAVAAGAEAGGDG